MNPVTIPFSRPYRSAKELDNLSAVLDSGHVHGDGPFTRSATDKLKRVTGVGNVLLTSSGTHALDMCSILLDLGPGDEVILPSFTFPSAANAIVLTGATPVFVDIEESTGNIDVAMVEQHVTERTKAISIVHYGGVAADMERLALVAQPRGIHIIEDNAHGLGGDFAGRKLGTFGTVAIQSFHDTKNIHSGEGGALLVNDPDLVSRAEIVREKGTDRSRFLRGQVDKYSWIDVGSSYLMSELNAAVLDSQLDEFDLIQAQRHTIWNAYSDGLADWATARGVTLMQVPRGGSHSAHVFYLLMPTHDDQTAFISHLRSGGIAAPFHYVPLDSAPAGLKYGRTPVPCVVSESFSRRLVRLPLWAGLTDDLVQRVIDSASSYEPAA